MTQSMAMKAMTGYMAVRVMTRLMGGMISACGDQDDVLYGTAKSIISMATEVMTSSMAVLALISFMAVKVTMRFLAM